MEISVKKAKKARLPHIPIEIIRDILLKMRVKSLIRAQCVCKEWRSTIQDPDFKLSYRGRRRVVVISRTRIFAVTSITSSLAVKKVFRHSKNSPFHNLSGLTHWSCVWCSCNGLVLFSVERHLFLWNMSTLCCAKVLEFPRLNDLDYDHVVLGKYYIPSTRDYNDHVVSGLCYVSSTGDYKAVLLVHPRRHRHRLNSENDDGYAFVASLRNKEWRKVPFPYNPDSARDGVDFRGTLHWRASDSSNKQKHPSRCNKIVYFDPECDEFRELPTPEPSQGEENEITGLGIIDDCLCMARILKETEEIEVLIMEEYNVKESWIRKFVISTSKFKNGGHQYMKLYSSRYNSKVLIWTHELYKWKMSVYHLKKNKLNKFLSESLFERSVGICSYAQSIASPNEFIWRDDDQHKRKWMNVYRV